MTDFLNSTDRLDMPAGETVEVRPLDWEMLHRRLIDADDPPIWRSLEELSESPEFFDSLHREFPRQASEWTDPTSRRQFLKLMGASLGLAGLGISGCIRQPEEKIVPYVRQPEDMVPGKPKYYATCTTLGGFATGVLVESHLGRPTKIEGNPDHPASLGATDAFAQASILSLYDPDRSQTVMHSGRISTWGEFLTAMTAQMVDRRRENGSGLAILTETITSPTLANQLQSLRRDLAEAQWFQYEPISRDNVRAGARLAFGEDVTTVYNFEKADIILSLDAEFLVGMPGSLRYCRDFIDRRRVAETSASSAESANKMNRLYAVESMPGLTGAQADHRLPMRAGDVELFTRILAKELGAVPSSQALDLPSEVSRDWLDAVVDDLQTHATRSLVIAGEGQPAIVHALVHVMNRQLKNVGQTVEYLAPVEAEPVDQLQSLTTLVDQMRSGRVQTLIVLGGNPIYNTPGELKFAEAYEQVKFRVHLSHEFDETSFASDWHIPKAHELECWSDARAFDGTTTIQQPLIAPLYEGRSDHELLSVMAGHPEQLAYQTVQHFWKTRLGADDFERTWRKAVHDGIVAGTRSEPRSPEWKFADQTRPDVGTDSKSSSPLGITWEITFGPDPTIWDGRFANNGWLQELPKPITKLTWDNAALISPRTAHRLSINNHDVLEVERNGRSISVPAWIVPGQPDDSIAISFGYGRSRSGRIGTGAGVNAFALRAAESAWFESGVDVRQTGRKYPLSVTQNHHSMEGRDLVQVGTIAQFQQNPEFISHDRRHPEEQSTLYPKAATAENAWGMAIDQTACVGCNACVVACQAENNIPIVGKEQVRIGREMHWLRIDRYYRGGLESPDTCFQPVMCVHCENAPCELVCPVAATVHSHEGLNQMVYNRCVGTRYCSNNCPYKVRRFNFLDDTGEMGYDGDHAPTLSLMRNPDVTVRSRGVMEKCTYCIQRINTAKIEAQMQNRPVKDGEIVTACQQVCPARAITFGNLNDRSSDVAKVKTSPLNYSLLAELNALPRTTHLARIRNPHPMLAGPATNDTPSLEPFPPIDRVKFGAEETGRVSLQSNGHVEAPTRFGGSAGVSSSQIQNAIAHGNSDRLEGS